MDKDALLLYKIKKNKKDREDRLVILKGLRRKYAKLAFENVELRHYGNINYKEEALIHSALMCKIRLVERSIKQDKESIKSLTERLNKK